jgi:hypothetical protein
MMNWIYTWYRTPGDAEAMAGESPGIEAIAGTMSEIFLKGFMAADLAASETAGAGAIATAGAVMTTNEKGQG